MTGQELLSSFQSAVSEATKQGYTYNVLVQVGN